MKNTFFNSFSAATLKSLLTASGREDLFVILLIIYWTYFVALAGFVFTPAFFVFMRRRGMNSLTPHQRTLLAIAEAREAIDNYLQRGTSKKRFMLRRIQRLTVYYWISPLRADWTQEPANQWFDPKAIQKEHKSIVNALSQFKQALILATNSRTMLKSFLQPLELLEKFFTSVVARTDPLFASLELPNDRTESEFNILLRFSRAARPLIIGVMAKRRARRKRSSILRWLEQIINSRLVRNAVGLSLLAAMIMALGVLVFRVDLSSAFLTWFTVTFGSLTISIGVTSFELSRQKHIPGSNDTQQ